MPERCVEARRRRRVPRALLALALLAALGCASPFQQFGYFVSLPWGAVFPRPKDSTLTYDKGSAYLYSKEEDWTLVLSARRLAEGVRGPKLLSEAEAKRLLVVGRKIVDADTELEWLGGRVLTFRGKRAMEFEYEGPSRGGQSALIFQAGEMLIHRVALVEVKNRLYRLHLRAMRDAPAVGLGVWEDVKEGLRFDGRSFVNFPGRDRIPEGTLDSLLRGAIAGEATGEAAGKKGAP